MGKNMSKWSQSLGDADDAMLREALELAHIPALLATLVHFKGSTDHFKQVQPQLDIVSEEQDGLNEEQRETAREMAFDVIRNYRDAGCQELPTPSEAVIFATMASITGQETAEAINPFLLEELNLFGEDRRKVTIDTQQMDESYKVIIIGSGMSGILAAIRLQQQGIPFEIIEKNSEIGGTWHENTYPGCQVDSSNHLYNYMFEPNNQWPGHYSGQADLYAYFAGIVEKYSLRKHIHLNTSVICSTYAEDTGLWHVKTESGGKRKTLEAGSVISAVGQLNTPKFPDIEGLDSFTGVAFHSAHWEHQHDLSGKSVIVIGTGCSAVQFVPLIAPQCDQLTIFQRTPPWLIPVEEYHQAMTEQELWLFRELPFYARWYRFYLFRSQAVDGYLPLLYADENWEGVNDTVSEANAMFREALIESLKEQVNGDSELLGKLIPNYPVGGKRPVLDDGSWITALQRDNVALSTEGIEKVVAEGVVTTDGTLHRADVIIYGTGFQADQLLTPMKVIGKDDAELVSQWGGNPQAYKGIVIPQFPNFYCLYGPNTNIVVGSSIVFFVECQMRYISGCIKLQLENSYKSLECKPEPLARYIEEIDALNKQRAWGSPIVSSWYKNDRGRVTQNWPGTHWEYWQQTLAPNLSDFEVV
ncbi:MAG: 4-hydroxyacetophenone monooxygenase [Halieaceae bacterium]|jgi:4-hydroxyacetophenone monooxygenase